MKNISKRQKIIGFIAILLIAIILAIIVTTNVINKNVGSEGYSATTANANSNLVASYIKEGITIGGITGTLESLNTFDATATAEDIIWGETAYVKGEKITGTKVVTVAQAKEANKTFETNTTLLDDYGNSVKVPAGFKISEDSATAATGGVVIEDVSAEGATEYTKGSQFVWIPVGNVKTDQKGNTTSIILGRYTFASNGDETLVQSAENYSEETKLKTSTTSSYYYRELLKTTSSSNTKAKDIEDFAKKALSSRGYYIGRYELGDATATSSHRTESSPDTNPVVCKTGVYPYEGVTQPRAANLCREMYKSIDFESDLINSYTWDTAIVFIQKFSGDVDYSRQTRLQNTLAKCGEATDGANNDVRCNIYDMAGNTLEWTTEVYSNVDASGVMRGDNHTHNGNYNTCYRSLYSSISVTYASPRPILYL